MALGDDSDARWQQGEVRPASAMAHVQCSAWWSALFVPLFSRVRVNTTLPIVMVGSVGLFEWASQLLPGTVRGYGREAR